MIYGANLICCFFQVLLIFSFFLLILLMDGAKNTAMGAPSHRRLPDQSHSFSEGCDLWWHYTPFTNMTSSFATLQQACFLCLFSKETQTYSSYACASSSWHFTYELCGNNINWLTPGYLSKILMSAREITTETTQQTPECNGDPKYNLTRSEVWVHLGPNCIGDIDLLHWKLASARSASIQTVHEPRSYTSRPKKNPYSQMKIF